MSKIIDILNIWTPGLEAIKLEYSLRLKIKRNDWLLADTCPKQPIIALYFESETVHKFYNLEALFPHQTFQKFEKTILQENKVCRR